MASPDSNQYHHHQHHQLHQEQHHGYSHHDHHHQQQQQHHQQQPQQQPQQPSLPPQVPSGGQDPYCDRAVLYPDHPHPQPVPLPHTLPQPLPQAPMDLDQPLDLSLTRSPRPASAGSYEGPAAKRPHLDSAASRDGGGMGRGGHSSLCMIRGCGCHNSAMPVHHHPHHHHHHHSHSPSPHHPYSRPHPHHRHSPYSPQYSPGHANPAVAAAVVGGGEPQGYPGPPHHYSLPPHPPASSSPSVLYGLGPSSSSSSSPYPLPPQERGSGSPQMLPSYAGGEMMRQGTSPGGFLCPPPHTSASPLSVSPRPRDNSPHPRSTPPQALGRAGDRDRDVSPRPFYRPFEVESRPVPEMPRAVAGSRLVPMEQYPSEDDLSASSTLLMLSNPQAGPPQSSSSSSSSSSSVLQTADSSRREYGQQVTRAMDEDGEDRTEPSQSDAGSGGVKTYHELTPQPPAARSTEQCDSNSYSRPFHKHDKHGKTLGPAQDGTVASSLPSSDDLRDSPLSEDKKTKPLETRFVKVVGSNPLVALREERAKRQAELSKDRMKELLVRRNDCHNNADSNDSEGVSDVNSSGQPSPKSSDGSDHDIGQGFPIPPDPNLKMSALDYLISKVLVEHRDIPFRACNTEIREIYTGARKGPLTLVDLIELQVEASLKA